MSQFSLLAAGTAEFGNGADIGFAIYILQNVVTRATVNSGYFCAAATAAAKEAIACRTLMMNDETNKQCQQTSSSISETPPSGLNESQIRQQQQSNQQAAVVTTTRPRDSSTTVPAAAAGGGGETMRQAASLVSATNNDADYNSEAQQRQAENLSNALHKRSVAENIDSASAAAAASLAIDEASIAAASSSSTPPPSPQLLQVALPAEVCTPEKVDEWFDKSLKLQFPNVAPREFGHFGSKSHPWRTAARLCCAGNLHDPLSDRVRNPPNLTKERATRVVRSALGPDLCPPERIFSKDPFRAVAIALSLQAKVVVTPMRAFTFFDRGGNQLIHQSEDFMKFLATHKIKWPPRRRQLEAEHSRLLAFESMIRKSQSQQPAAGKAKAASLSAPVGESISSTGAAASTVMSSEVKDEPSLLRSRELGPSCSASSTSGYQVTLGGRRHTAPLMNFPGVDISPRGLKMRRITDASEDDTPGDNSGDEAGPTIPIRKYLSLRQAAADAAAQHAASSPKMSPSSERLFPVPAPPDDKARQARLLRELSRDVTKDLGVYEDNTSTLVPPMMPTPHHPAAQSCSWLPEPANLAFSGASIFQSWPPPHHQRYSYDGGTPATSPSIRHHGEVRAQQNLQHVSMPTLPPVGPATFPSIQHQCEVRAQQNLQHVSMPTLPLVGPSDWQQPPQQHFDMSAASFQDFPSMSDSQFMKAPDDLYMQNPDVDGMIVKNVKQEPSNNL